MPSQPPPYHTPGRGRPRRDDIDQRITAATIALLAEHGYAALTLEAVATAAGVTRPTIYRRWSGKAALAAGALAATVPPLDAADTGDALADLCALAVVFATTITGTGYAATFFALQAEARHDPELAEQVCLTHLGPPAVAVTELIQRGQRAGRIQPGLAPEVVRDLIFGPLIYRWMVAGQPIDPATARELVDTASRAFRVG
ncbi:TetR/AcrR family transcriptional regulator [Nocardia sp. NPDC020380]|uniref:TetR/AcrR family transcriptional regulator n=1 Tax=Nocardia sp. NPDC020380 TaxID=3364309 RepID=UPI0037A0C6D3